MYPYGISQQSSLLYYYRFPIHTNNLTRSMPFGVPFSFKENFIPYLYFFNLMGTYSCSQNSIYPIPVFNFLVAFSHFLLQIEQIRELLSLYVVQIHSWPFLPFG